MFLLNILANIFLTQLRKSEMCDNLYVDGLVMAVFSGSDAGAGDARRDVPAAVPPGGGDAGGVCF